MPKQPQTGTSQRRWRFLAVVGALAIVAVSSTGNPVSTVLRSGHPDRLELVGIVLVIAGACAAAALALALPFHFLIVSKGSPAVPLWHTLLRAVPYATAVIATLALLSIARVQMGVAPIPQLTIYLSDAQRPAQPLGIRDQRSPPVITEERDPEPVDTVFAEAEARAPDSPPYGRMLLGLIALALALTMLSKRRRARARRVRNLPAEGVTAAAQAAVHGALVSTIDAMLSDADPRTAIIGAYARLTEDLSQRGLGRHDYEGPMEHLRRVLTRVRVQPEPLRRLIRLFALARFSTHPLTQADREQALAALRAVAQDITVQTPRAAALR